MIAEKVLDLCIMCVYFCSFDDVESLKLCCELQKWHILLPVAASVPWQG